ncbi:SLC13 family permease [Xanthovirga aplysinae]|uniref:SLC13 family permease n=1 Tax=Xanthovirga aplysinae TaxID=2529853 RepID=UPI0012BBCE9D|nr:SLC13 family permease [Xanthovirga aplysinae]MTI32518.1 SLC13/DASS family transporter [Xanthovirga aplysinae]
MIANQIILSWKALWEQHDKTKQLLKFSVKGTSTLTKEKQSAVSKEDQLRPDKPYYRPVQLIGLILGPLLFALCLLFFHPEGLSDEGRGVLAGTLWIIVWWLTEAIPIPATSLLPLIIFPLTNSMSMQKATLGYSDKLLFLYMGGFMIALTMERWRLDKRIALFIISIIGTRPDRIVLGFMLATAFLSMWINNVATAMMMVPIGLAIIFQFTDALKDHKGIDTNPDNFKLGKALMLGIAYAASIGGLATITGSVPNALFVGMINTFYGQSMDFGTWLLFGIPITVVFLLGTWWYLVKIAFPLKIDDLPVGKEVIQNEKGKLGVMKGEELAVLVVFSLTALAYISRSLLFKGMNLSDTTIAITGAVVLFLIPAPNHKGQFILNWETAKNIPWGIILLFGGGLTIAVGIKETGLDEWIGTQLTVLRGIPLIFIIMAVAALVLFLTEVSSNTATSTMMIPLMGALAMSINVHPYTLMVAAAIAASCAFMLPIATPPNAFVFGSGYIKMGEMAKAGFWLNLFGILVITLFVYFVIPFIWGIDLGVFPESFR